MTEKFYMQHAISLAKKGIGRTSPNPLVGAVVVKNGIIIARGYHEKAGDFHAERSALLSCTENPAGASLFVTLEPCCHHGRTPPCTDLIIQMGIAHVYIGSLDPNPLVRGKGVSALKNAGIQVTEGLLQEACDELNPIFFHYITKKTPYVALKYAMTADGKIATATGASQWISNEISRNHAQFLRHTYRSILVGIGTVLADDPLLTCRMSGGKQPLRIVCDSHLRIPSSSRLCQSAKEIPTLIAHASNNEEKIRELKHLGLTLAYLPGEKGQVSLSLLMETLAKAEIDSILVEGGSQIHASFLAENLVQRLYVYLAPKIFGGKTAPSPVGGTGVSHPDQSILLRLKQTQALGGDLLLAYDVLPKKGVLPCLQA